MNYIKLSILLFCLPFNTALAGEIFSTSFESGSLDVAKKQQNGFFWRVGVNTTVSTSNSNSGSYSLKLAFPAKIPNSFSEQAFDLGGHYPDLWIKYDLFIPSNYTHTKEINPNNNKGFVMLWGGNYGAPGAEGPKIGLHFYPTGSDGGTEVALFAKSYIQDKIVLNKNWVCSTCGDGKSDQAITANDRGHWMTIVVHAKYASASNNNGVYELWKTDWQGKTTKLIDVQDGPWYSTMPDSTNPARGFNNGYLLGWANSGYAEETIFYIDNVTFSTTPLTNNYVYVAAPKPPQLF